MSKQWMRLDNAALIFPATRSRKWANCFRVSATLHERIEPSLLQQAVNDLKPRFPSMFVRLRRGVFWYYLEEISQPPKVHQDYAYPLPHMDREEIRSCCLRVLYYKNRIGVEFFHALTDGNGGMVFLKTLTARYLELAHDIRVPASDGILDWTKQPSAEELEDSFQKYASKYPLRQSEPNVSHFRGSYTPNFLFLTTGVVPTAKLLNAAHTYGVSVTSFLAAVMTQVLLEKQADEAPTLSRRKPVMICVPVNLRKLYGSKTLRNFVLTVNPGVDPRLGSYTLQELCTAVSSQLAAEVTPQKMAGRMAPNVNPANNPAVKLAPLFLKNVIMQMVYDARGETKGCLNVSNLGRQTLPDNMEPFVDRLEFIIGVQQTYPNNCSVVSFGENTFINMIRNIRESDLERRFFSRLVSLDVPVAIESNEGNYRSG